MEAFMKKFITRRTYLLFPVGVLLVAVYLVACTPGSEITVAESDIVGTLYNNKFNFGAVTTYAMPDSIFHLTGDPDVPDSPNISRDNDDAILALVESNFLTRGYTKVAPGANPDFQVLVAVTATEVWGVYSYYPWTPWYPGYPWYGWYYPPVVGASYQYTMGTLVIQMGEFFDEIPGEGTTISAYWMAAMNGIMDDTDANVQRRITDGINQSFIQSPYLKSNP
jgi:hypothetical protein